MMVHPGSKSTGCYVNLVGFILSVLILLAAVGLLVVIF